MTQTRAPWCQPCPTDARGQEAGRGQTEAARPGPRQKRGGQRGQHTVRGGRARPGRRPGEGRRLFGVLGLLLQEHRGPAPCESPLCGAGCRGVGGTRLGRGPASGCFCILAEARQLPNDGRRVAAGRAPRAHLPVPSLGGAERSFLVGSQTPFRPPHRTPGPASHAAERPAQASPGSLGVRGGAAGAPVAAAGRRPRPGACAPSTRPPPGRGPAELRRPPVPWSSADSHSAHEKLHEVFFFKGEL